jgi:putative acetyltransferase
LAVDPTFQRQGIGGALVEECLDRLRSHAASGCVVLGDPTYYGRFGFRSHAGLSYKGAPAEYFMAVSFGAIIPQEEVTYHAAFDGEA